MARLYVARRKNRIGLSIPMNQVSSSPNLLFPLTKSTDPGQLDESIRAELEKLGITKESDVQAVFDKAEADFEYRVKVQEVRQEIRRLMELKRNGAKLIQIGHRKWKEAFFPK